MADVTDETVDATNSLMRARGAAINEARGAGFAAVLRDGVPFIPVEDLPTMERKRDAIRWVGKAKHVGGARLFREGMVLEPPARGPEPVADWPLTEPAVAARYGMCANYHECKQFEKTVPAQEGDLCTECGHSLLHVSGLTWEDAREKGYLA